MTAQTVTTRTQHPCTGMTKAQLEAFEAIAVNQRPRCTRRVLDALIARGLIVKDMETLGRDALGPIMIAQYVVPLCYHMQWCRWASEREGGP